MMRQNPFFRVPAHGRNKGVPDSLQGYFLVSENNMLDPHFVETVVLIIDHSKDGAFGVVVNRRSDFTLEDISPPLSKNPRSDLYMYIGGPVQQDCLLALHSRMPEEHENSQHAIKPMEGVTFEPSLSHIEKYLDESYWNSLPLDDEIPQIQLYLGCSGWGPGQLEEEVQGSSWILHPGQADIVFHPKPEESWREALRAKGGIYKVFANTQQDPSLN